MAMRLAKNAMAAFPVAVGVFAAFFVSPVPAFAFQQVAAERVADMAVSPV